MKYRFTRSVEVFEELKQPRISMNIYRYVYYNSVIGYLRIFTIIKAYSHEYSIYAIELTRLQLNLTDLVAIIAAVVAAIIVFSTYSHCSVYANLS